MKHALSFDYSRFFVNNAKFTSSLTHSRQVVMFKKSGAENKNKVDCDTIDRIK